MLSLNHLFEIVMLSNRSVRCLLGHTRVFFQPRQVNKANYSSSKFNTDEVTENISIRWKNRDGTTLTTQTAVGVSLLTVAHKFGVDLEGACEGVCACSTCHVILTQVAFATI